MSWHQWFYNEAVPWTLACIFLETFCHNGYCSQPGGTRKGQCMVLQTLPFFSLQPQDLSCYFSQLLSTLTARINFSLILVHWTLFWVIDVCMFYNWSSKTSIPVCHLKLTFPCCSVHHSPILFRTESGWWIMMSSL